MLIPLAIQAAHAIENHEHTVCKSITDHHVHEKDLDCSDLHQILETYSSGNTTDYTVIPTHFYSQDYNEQPQQITVVYISKKNSRGPPNFTV